MFNQENDSVEQQFLAILSSFQKEIDDFFQLTYVSIIYWFGRRGELGTSLPGCRKADADDYQTQQNTEQHRKVRKDRNGFQLFTRAKNSADSARFEVSDEMSIQSSVAINV